MEASERASSQLLERGVLGSVVGKRVAVAPAFVITEDELDAALDVMLSVMKEVKPV